MRKKWEVEKMEILEMKNKTSEMKLYLKWDQQQIILDTAEEKISQLEETAIQKEKKGIKDLKEIIVVMTCGTI